MRRNAKPAATNSRATTATLNVSATTISAHSDPVKAWRKVGSLQTDDWLIAQLGLLGYLQSLDGSSDQLSDDGRKLVEWQYEAFADVLARRAQTQRPFQPPTRLGFDRVFVEQCKAAVPLVDLIHDDGVALRAVGNGYRGRCPVHKGESDNSVSVTSNVWFCHGCQVGGDQLAWMQFTMRWEFSEALAYLAGKAGLPWPERTLPQAQATRSMVKKATVPKTQIVAGKVVAL